LCVRVCVRAIV